jgi:hypothetical protein
MSEECESISLGWNCESAIRGVNLGIRSRREHGYKTCPFDECNTNYEGILLCLEDDFKYFFDPEYLKIIPAKKTSELVLLEKGVLLVYNTRYNFIFNHESPFGHLHESQKWPGGLTHYVDNDFYFFKQRYTRRIENFKNYLSSGKKITFIISKYDNDTNKLSELLKEKYPTLNFEIQCFMPSCSQEFYDIMLDFMTNPEE